MTGNIIQFRRKGRDTVPDDDEPILYVTVYSNRTVIDDPADETGDPFNAAMKLFDATSNVMAGTDHTLVMVGIGVDRTHMFGIPQAFDTPEARRWLARRLDDVYDSMTGYTRQPIRSFLRRILSMGNDE